MNKRSFLKNAGLIGAALALPGMWFSSCSSAEGKTGVKCWTWTGVKADMSDDDLRQWLAQLAHAGISGLLIGGEDDRIFEMAKSLGFETHLWMWTLNRRDSFIMENHPEWYAINRLGQSCFDKPQYVDYYRWLCPSKPEVQEYLEQVVSAHLENPLIDGIHLDYVRYCDVILPRALWEKYDIVQNEELPPYDYCYCDTCRSTFESQQGVDPLELTDPASHKLWLQYRYDSVTNVVNRLSDLVHSHNKPISAAVFPSPTIARKLVRQSWDDWNLDMVFPMLYHGFYNEDTRWVGNCVVEGREALAPNVPLYAGLYMPDLEELSEYAEAIKSSVDAGAAGISIFGDLTPAHLEHLEAL